MGRAIALAAPPGGFAPAHAVGGSRTGAGWRFSPAVEQLFENGRVIVCLVLRAKQEGQALAFVSDLVQPAERLFGFRLRQFLQIFSAKIWPTVGAGMIPASQFVRRRKVAQPFVNRGAGFRETSRPQPVDEHTRSVGARRRLINALDRNHEAGKAALCSIIVTWLIAPRVADSSRLAGASERQRYARANPDT